MDKARRIEGHFCDQHEREQGFVDRSLVATLRGVDRRVTTRPALIPLRTICVYFLDDKRKKIALTALGRDGKRPDKPTGLIGPIFQMV
jgi:hypothetical protein